MRRVNRGDIAPPRVLTEPGRPGPNELEKVRAHRADPATRDKSFKFAVYKHDEVKAALEHLFHGKCAYCETFYSAQAPVDVEHFRPKGAVADAPDHPGYWWIAMAWDNLLPSCIDCNRRRKQQAPDPKASLSELVAGARTDTQTGKKDAFPVAGTRAAVDTDALELERAYLIDPCRDDPMAHIEFHLDPGDLWPLALPKRPPGAAAVAAGLGDGAAIAEHAEALGLSVRGAVSIQVYGLNRLGLVQNRARLLKHLEFLRGLIFEIDIIAADLDAHADPAVRRASASLSDLSDRILEELRAMTAPEAPYSALVQQWCDRFLDELNA
ncbi:HNH endonuclease family protein [Roseivivax sp. CAU 1753]